MGEAGRLGGGNIACMFDQYRLPNGAHVVLIPLKGTTSVTVLIMYGVGSRYEDNKIRGMSHYIEHLMFKGTTKRKNTLILTREIDRLGAEYNAFTGKEHTAYYIKIDAAYTQFALEILADMLFNSLFDPKEMEREKGPIIEEIRMYRDNPVMNIDSEFEDLLYAGSPLGIDIAGTPEHVRSYTRPDTLAHRDAHYQPGNMTVIVAGGIPKDTTQWVGEYIGVHHNKHTTSSAFTAAHYGPSSKTKRIAVRQMKIDQAQLYIGFPGFSYTDPRNEAVSVMNAILGGSMSSRLFIQIRERRGLAYRVRSGAEQFRDTGYSYIQMGLESKNINKALKVVRAEIEKMATKGVSARELNDAKTHIHGSLALSLEDSSVQANWYAKQAVFYEKIKTPQEKLQKINAVTREDVIKVARELFKWNQARIAIIGDVDKGKVVF